MDTFVRAKAHGELAITARDGTNGDGGAAREEEPQRGRGAALPNILHRAGSADAPPVPPGCHRFPHVSVIHRVSPIRSRTSPQLLPDPDRGSPLRVSIPIDLRTVARDAWPMRALPHPLFLPVPAKAGILLPLEKGRRGGGLCSDWRIAPPSMASWPWPWPNVQGRVSSLEEGEQEGGTTDGWSYRSILCTSPHQCTGLPYPLFLSFSLRRRDSGAEVSALVCVSPLPSMVSRICDQRFIVL
jgi:hypothetical protein